MNESNVGLDENRLRAIRVALQATVLVAVLGTLIQVFGLHDRSLAVTGWGVGLLLVAPRAARARRLDRQDALVAMLFIGLALWCSVHGQNLLGWFSSIVACLMLVMPELPPLPATPDERRRVWELVQSTRRDALAPFALRTDKSVLFSDDGRAAIAYRVCLGVCVASGDPVGDPASFPQVIDAFIANARARGWRLSVLGASVRSLELWRERGLWALSVGREVVLDVGAFAMIGRRYRNLRQSVQHTHNCGVTTQILKEEEIGAEIRRELIEVIGSTPSGLHPRGFAMILDTPLRGDHPGIIYALARDADGKVVACQRFGTADHGRELSMDLPWRVRGAPNGVDERMIIDVVDWAKARKGERVSLAFAAFPELFADVQRSIATRAANRLVHLLDRFIKLESLYRFLRKFHAFGVERFVGLKRREIVIVAIALLTLEFGPPPRASTHQRLARRRARLLREELGRA
jgi:lysylphosphatidylglycerol synthetase-like protein (DUF2156 family)